MFDENNIDRTMFDENNIDLLLHHHPYHHHQDPTRDEDQEEEDEEAEEALSLCDLPLDNNNNEEANDPHDQYFNDMSSKHVHHARRSSSDHLFEFFSDLSFHESFNMCSAEDIIVCGKLIPFKDITPRHYHQQRPKTTSTPTPNNNNNDYHKKQTAYRRRSESLSELHSSSVMTRSSSTKKTQQIMMRNSRSLDYRELHRQSSMVSPGTDSMERNSSVKSVGKPSDKIKSTSKPRWSFFMFGIVKFPAEMDLTDIKSRQLRRNQSTGLFPAVDSEGKLSVNRSSGKGSWRLLKALSCKDHASVAVTTPHYVPQV